MREGMRRDADMGATLIRIVLQSMMPENREKFVTHLVTDFAPDIQVKMYGFVKEMIRFWAGGDDLSHEDAAAIEDCRKICDLMGWPINSGY